MSTDFKIKVDVYFKENRSKMVRTFKGEFEPENATTLNQAAATMVKELEAHPNFPAAPTRLVISVYPKKKAAEKNQCPPARHNARSALGGSVVNSLGGAK